MEAKDYAGYRGYGLRASLPGGGGGDLDENMAASQQAAAWWLLQRRAISESRQRTRTLKSDRQAGGCLVSWLAGWPAGEPLLLTHKQLGGRTKRASGEQRRGRRRRLAAAASMKAAAAKPKAKAEAKDEPRLDSLFICPLARLSVYIRV